MSKWMTYFRTGSFYEPENTRQRRTKKDTVDVRPELEKSDMKALIIAASMVILPVLLGMIIIFALIVIIFLGVM